MKWKFWPRDLVQKISIATSVKAHELGALQHGSHIVSAAIARYRNCTEIKFVDIKEAIHPLYSSEEYNSILHDLLTNIWKGILESGLNICSIKCSAHRGKPGPSTQPLPLRTFMFSPIVREGLKMTALKRLDLLVSVTKLGEDNYLAKAISNMPSIEDFSLRVDKFYRDIRFEAPLEHLFQIKFADSLFRDLAGKLELTMLKTLHVETPIENSVHLMAFIGQYASVLDNLSLDLMTPRYASLYELIEMFGGASEAYPVLGQFILCACYYHLDRKEVEHSMGWTADELRPQEEGAICRVGDGSFKS